MSACPFNNVIFPILRELVNLTKTQYVKINCKLYTDFYSKKNYFLAIESIE